jgi:hypothetical protein
MSPENQPEKESMKIGYVPLAKVVNRAVLKSLNFQG